MLVETHPDRIVVMGIGSVLIAETDPAIRQGLLRIFADHLPQIDVDVCSSPQQTTQRLLHAHYSTVVAAPHLIQKEPSLLLHRTEHRYVLAPVIVTASSIDIEPARDCLLHRGAFDVIAKPVDDVEALTSVRIALWQARFFQLLTQRERVLSSFHRHIEDYPEERSVREIMGMVLKRVDNTVTLVQESMKLIDPSNDGLFFDLLASVEERTKEKALARLDRLSVCAMEGLGFRFPEPALSPLDLPPSDLALIGIPDPVNSDTTRSSNGGLR